MSCTDALAERDATIVELQAKIARLEAAASAGPAMEAGGERPQRRRAAETEDVAPIISGDGARRACATNPCGLEGTCLNGGGCAVGARQGDAAGSFACHCPTGYGGPRCASASDDHDPPPPGGGH